VLSLVVSISLLVMWVLYVVRARSQINALAGRVGPGGENFHWVVLAVGCALLALLIGGLTYQLAQALAARRYSEKQDELVSNITHELKSPLAGIKLHAQTLEHSGLSESQRRRSVEFILAEVERMSSLVDNVLESSRLLARKKRLALKPVDLGKLLSGYLALARPRVEAHGMRLVVVGETRAVVRATEEALERVLTNLIDNAVRFSVRGGEVRCRLSDQPGKVVIAVEDDGIGIPKSELAKVFDRFYQIRHEIHDRRRGTGLGLSIVSGLVGEMRGTVEAFSQEDRPGTRFVVELPMLEGGR
jgi:signal transduction histidine kinase